MAGQAEQAGLEAALLSEAHKRGGLHAVVTQPHFSQVHLQEPCICTAECGPLTVDDRTDRKEQMLTCLVMFRIVQEVSVSVSTNKGRMGDPRSEVELISTRTIQSTSRQP